MRSAIPLTGLSFGFLQWLAVPFRYSPIAILPALCLILFLQIRSWRDRQSGRRFSQYDADDVGG